jgi:hypothetical protein
MRPFASNSRGACATLMAAVAFEPFFKDLPPAATSQASRNL